MEFLVPCHVCRLIHRQPIRPLLEADARRLRTYFLHLRNEVVHILMRYGLQRLD